MKNNQILTSDTVEYQVLTYSEQGSETVLRTNDLWEAIAFYWKHKDDNLPYGLNIDQWIEREEQTPIKVKDFDVRYDVLDWFLAECGFFSQENREQIMERVNKMKLHPID